MYVPVCTNMYCVVLDKMCDVQAHSIQSAGTVRLDINLLKPLRLEFPVQALATQLPLPAVHRGSSPPDWLEYVYRPATKFCSGFPPSLQWLWKFGLGKPRLGGLTVDETAMRKNTDCATSVLVTVTLLQCILSCSPAGLTLREMVSALLDTSQHAELLLPLLPPGCLGIASSLLLADWQMTALYKNVFDCAPCSLGPGGSRQPPFTFRGAFLDRPSTAATEKALQLTQIISNSIWY